MSTATTIMVPMLPAMSFPPAGAMMDRRSSTHPGRKKRTQSTRTDENRDPLTMMSHPIWFGKRVWERDTNHP